MEKNHNVRVIALNLSGDFSWYLHELIQWRPCPYGQENDIGFFWYVFLWYIFTY